MTVRPYALLDLPALLLAAGCIDVMRSQDANAPVRRLAALPSGKAHGSQVPKPSAFSTDSAPPIRRPITRRWRSDSSLRAQPAVVKMPW